MDLVAICTGCLGFSFRSVEGRLLVGAGYVVLLQHGNNQVFLQLDSCPVTYTSCPAVSETRYTSCLGTCAALLQWNRRRMENNVCL